MMPPERNLLKKGSGLSSRAERPTERRPGAPPRSAAPERRPERRPGAPTARAPTARAPRARAPRAPSPSPRLLAGRLPPLGRASGRRCAAAERRPERHPGAPPRSADRPSADRPSAVRPLRSAHDAPLTRPSLLS